MQASSKYHRWIARSIWYTVPMEQKSTKYYYWCPKKPCCDVPSKKHRSDVPSITVVMLQEAPLRCIKQEASRNYASEHSCKHRCDAPSNNHRCYMPSKSQVAPLDDAKSASQVAVLGKAWWRCASIANVKVGSSYFPENISARIFSDNWNTIFLNWAH